MKPLKVTPLAGERGRYNVTARRLVCTRSPVCRYTYKFPRVLEPFRSAGDECPKCLEGILETTTYLAEVTLYAGLGKCGCPDWQFNLQPIVAKLTPTEIFARRDDQTLRCEHLKAALLIYALEEIDRQNMQTLKNLQERREREGE